MNSISKLLLVIILTSWTSSVMAERRSDANQAGTVRFYGTIVDGGCSIEVQHARQLQTLCQQNGQRVSQQQAAVSSLPLPLRQGTTRFSWIDRSNAQALVTVAYY